MRKIWSMVAAGVIALSTLPAQAESLADALIAAYRNSHLLEQNQAVLRAADEDFAVAVARLRPVIAYTAQAAWVNQETSSFSNTFPIVPITRHVESLSASISLTASLLLLDWGRTELGIAVARETVMATRQALVGIEQDVLLSAVLAYVDVGLQTNIVLLRQSNTRLITQELRAAKDRFEVGEVTRTDVAQAEARLASANAGLAAANGALMLARERYKAVTGDYPGNLKGLPKPPATAGSLEAARAVALRTHPVILQSQRQATIADLRVQLAKAGMRPTLMAQGSLSQNMREGSQAFDNQTLSLTFNQTIYAGGELSALYRRSLAGKDAAMAGLHQTAVNVSESVGQAWANLSVASASIQAGDQQVRAAQVAYDGVREEASLGSRTTLDVLDAEQALLDAKALRLEAEANSYVGTYQLLSVMGLLTVDHLQLGIATYDPEAYFNAVKNAPINSAQGAKLDRILKTIGN